MVSVFAAARGRGFASALLCLSCMAQAHAGGEGRIDTDGPDFVESTESVSRGRVQFEAGPQWEQERQGGARLRTVSMLVLLLSLIHI